MEETPAGLSIKELAEICRNCHFLNYLCARPLHRVPTLHFYTKAAEPFLEWIVTHPRAWKALLNSEENFF